MFTLRPVRRNEVAGTRPNSFYSLYDMMNDFFKDDFFTLGNFENDTFRVDVKDKSNEYLVEAELPGVKKEEVKLDYNDGVLSIRIERNNEKEDKDGDYLHQERVYSSMERCLRLPNINLEEVTAKLEEGVLKIEAPKLALKDKMSTIEIK